jgi:glucosamine-6-phosphate isomerase
MELKIFKDYSELSMAAAIQIVNCIKSKPNAVLCFATGDTPKLAYQKVGEIAKQHNVDLTKCFFIGLDEWLGIPPANTGSCNYFLHHYLFVPLGIKSSQVHLFDALTMNEEMECERMNKLIEEKGGIDLMLVGVGINGHIGFNEPGADIDSNAHIARLEEITKSIGQKYFNEEVTIDKGMTIGLKQVMNAKSLIMMANGKKKALVIRRIINENISTDFPATLMRQHKNALLMVDEEAASELEKPAV